MINFGFKCKYFKKSKKKSFQYFLLKVKINIVLYTYICAYTCTLTDFSMGNNSE